MSGRGQGIKCEHGDSDRMPCGKCRICSKKSRSKTLAKRGPDTKCRKGHVGSWYSDGSCKICAKQMYWRSRQKPGNVEKQRLRSEKYTKKLRSQPDAPYPPTKHCECCLGPFDKKGPNLDHCHVTGVFRGWLCTKCNLGIGQLGDTVEGLIKALVYLSKSPITSGRTKSCALPAQS